MRVELLPTTKLHTIQLACWMRRPDVDECAAVGLAPLQATFEAWKASDFCTTLLADGEVAACGGVVLEGTTSALGFRRTGVAWLLTSKVADTIPMALHRTAKEWLRQARQHVDLVWNRVDARHVRSLRWLEALGFRVYPARPHGPRELPFHLVVREF